MTLELPDLPYSHDALENNGMCKETMEFHHDLHHKAYVDNGNKLLAGSEYEGKDIEAIIFAKENFKRVYQKIKISIIACLP